MEGVIDLSVAGRTKEQTEPSSGGLPTVWRCDLPGVTMRLENCELWREFHGLGTEMIITKTGRRMFPSLQFRVSGLESSEHYVVMLDFVPTSLHRYRFSANTWTEAGSSEHHLVPSPRVYIHPDSPAKGSRWMSEPVSLHKAKITNNPTDENGHSMLMSMHKYIPRVTVAKTADVPAALWSPMCVCSFPETEFIAVTAYQNKKITNLKINTNPFARGFREGGQSKSKRKSQSKDDSAAEHPDTMEQPRRRRWSEQSSEISTEDSGCVSVGSCSPAPEPAPDDRRLTAAPAACEQTSPDPRLHYVPCTYSSPHDLWGFPYYQTPGPLLVHTLPLHGLWGPPSLLPPPHYVPRLGMPAWNDQLLNSVLHEKGYVSSSS